MLGFDFSRWLPAVIACLASVLSAAGQSSGGPADIPETLHFDVEWRLITAGTAVLEHTGSTLNMRLQSAGLVSKLYKVDDTYTVSYRPGLCLASLHLAAQEGRRRRDTRVTVDPAAKRADYLERDLVKNTVFRQSHVEVPPCVHDSLGALRALRTMNIEVGKSAEVPVTDGKKYAAVRVEAQERENIKVKGKPYRTIRYEAFIFNNVIYSRKGRLLIWITDDARRLPVQVQARMSFPIGNVTLTLKEETK